MPDINPHGTAERASETNWIFDLKLSQVYCLMTFERKILRKIFVPKRTNDGYWRIKTNREINDRLKGKKYNWVY